MILSVVVIVFFAVFVLTLRARTLQIDLKKAGIPYQDDMGRYSDLNSLRCTWGLIFKKMELTPNGHGIDTSLRSKAD